MPYTPTVWENDPSTATPVNDDNLNHLETGVDEAHIAIDGHLADATDAHDATAISYAGSAGLSATTVEAALDELDTEKQAADADLTAIAGLTSAADKSPYFTGSGTAALATLTAAGRALVDDADAAAQRVTLGLSQVSATTSMFRSGMYTTPPHTTRTTGAPAVGTLFYVPLRVGRAITLDRIGIEVTATIATGLIRLGIYADNGLDAPSALLVDAGTVSGSAATGLILATISQALTPSLVWLAVVAQTAAATLRATGAYLDMVASTAAEVVGAAVNAKSYVETGVTGALPATATPGAVNLGPSLVIVRPV